MIIRDAILPATTPVAVAATSFKVDLGAEACVTGAGADAGAGGAGDGAGAVLGGVLALTGGLAGGLTGGLAGGLEAGLDEEDLVIDQD